MPPIQDECKSKFEEIEKILNGSAEHWRLLQTKLEEGEECFLEGKLDALKKWFNLDEAELLITTPGSVRHCCQDRIHRIIVQPLLERMVSKIGFVRSSEEEETPGSESGPPVSLVEDVVQQWEVHISPVYKEAKAEDDKLQKKIRKTEKDEKAQGVMALTGDTKKVAALKRQRPAIWETAQAVLDKFAAPVKRLQAFFAEELGSDTTARLIAAVPAIVSRAVCDWYYQRCQVDLDQLATWWKGTKQILQRNDKIWARLQEEEPRLLSNVESGLEDVDGQKHRYSMYATFGGSETEIKQELVDAKLEEKVTLLAHEVSEMHKRLKMIRDSALWRLIDVAHDIQKALKAESLDVAPWPTVGAEEGLVALAQSIGCSCDDEPASLAVPTESAEIENGALVVMDRLQKLMGLCSDIKEYVAKIGASEVEGISATLDALVQLAAQANEELLCLLHDPSPSALTTWQQLWANAAEVDKGQRIESTMAALPLKRDSELKPAAQKERRKWLAVLRGVQVLLNQTAIQAWVVSPLMQSGPGSPTSRLNSPSPHRQDIGFEEFSLSPPPSPRQVELSAPGGGFPYRPPNRESLPGSEEDDTTKDGSTDAPVTSHVTTMERPSSRPITPKFIDGKYVTVRPGSAGMKLPPIEHTLA
jgi:hypothetical protein